MDFYDILGWVVIFLSILWVELFVRRFPPIIGLVIYTLLPAFMTIYWLIDGNELGFSPFMYYRFYLVFTALIYMQVMRWKNWQDKYGVFYWILLFNIFEKVANEMELGEIHNWIVAGMGIALALTLAGPERVKLEATKHTPNFTYDLGWYWIIAFTIWSITFAYGFLQKHSSVISIYDIAIPLFLMRRRSELYIQYAAFVLGMVMFIWEFPPLRKMVEVRAIYYERDIHLGFVGMTALFALFLVYEAIRDNRAPLVNFVRYIYYRLRNIITH